MHRFFGGHSDRQPNSSNDDTDGDRRFKASSNHFHRLGAKSIRIEGQKDIFSVALLADGKHIAYGGSEKKIRCWRTADGHEVEKSANTGDVVFNIVASEDGKWVVGGLADGFVTVWSADSFKLVAKFKAHHYWVRGVDVSADGARIASGSGDTTVCVWSCPDGDQLLRPLKHHRTVAAVKFSPNGQFIATATSEHNSVRVYDSQDGHLFFDAPILVNSLYNQSLAWVNNKTLFALSRDGEVGWLDVDARRAVLKWPILGSRNPACVSLASNGKFIAVSDGSSVSLWDIKTHKKIGSVIKHPDSIESMTISPNQVLVIAGGESVTIQSLHGILPSLYLDIKPEDGDLRRAHEQRLRCEDLYDKDRILDAALAVAEFSTGVGEEVKSQSLMDWLANFTNRCALKLEKVGDDAALAEKHDEALRAYSTILSLGPSPPDNVIIKWAHTAIILGPVNEALRAPVKLKFPRFVLYRAICDVLEQEGRVAEASEYFDQMQNDLNVDTSNERAHWEHDFQQRCAEKREQLADVAMDDKNDDKVKVEHLTIAQPLGGVVQANIPIKRHNALMRKNPSDKLSSHRGYKAALRNAGRHAGAVGEKLIVSDQSSHDTRPAGRKTVKEALEHMPRILIDTTTGRLCDRDQRSTEFESLPIWDELVSSMAHELDHARIESEVKKFSQYVMLSHTWEEDEPLLQKVKNMSVYNLQPSPTNTKLHKFCLLVRDLGFRWAWADTTCIDQENNVILQESLVAMFRWYRGSSLTLVYLRDVSSESQLPEGLRHSKWNTRGWTYQEYVAAETVRFYTADWKPYLGLDMMNHKESPIVRAEMQQATGVLTQDMEVLRPGLDRIRQKLYVASMRETTRTEDIAYSLLGIFNIAIPAMYGEGKRAIGRFLEHILTGSGDVAILAWTGRAGDYNSCLPLDLTVYKELEPPHIPRPIENVEMDKLVTALRSSVATGNSDLSLAISLLNRLKALPSASIASTRLRLPGILLPLGDFTREPDGVYRASSSLFGDIEVKTACDLTAMKDLFLIYPWIRSLLDRRSTDLDEETQGLRMLVRLRRPFGALLLQLQSVEHTVEHKRIAADSLIMVQLREDASLQELIDGVCMAVEIQ